MDWPVTLRIHCPGSSRLEDIIGAAAATEAGEAGDEQNENEGDARDCPDHPGIELGVT